MKPRDLQYVKIEKNLDLVTEYEIPGIPEVYAVRLKGIRTDRPGTVFERDPGTIQVYDEYPQSPNPSGIPIDLWKGFRLYDVVAGTEHQIVVGLDVNGSLRVYVDDAGWPELTRQLFCVIGSTPSAKVIELTNVKDALGSAVTIASDELVGWVCENATKNQMGLVMSNDGTLVTLDLLVDDTGLGWATGDVIILHRTDVTFHGWKFDNGGTPHVRWLAVEDRRKTYLLTGSSGDPIVPNYPVVIEKYEGRNYFYASSSPLAALPAGWYVQLAGGLIPAYKETGSLSTPLDMIMEPAVPDVDFEDPDGNEFLTMNIELHAGLPGVGNAHTKFALTVIYDDYMESDPIWRGFFTQSQGADVNILGIQLNLSFARMPKHISGFRIYRAIREKTVTPNFADWLDADEDYLLWEEVTINGQSTRAVGDISGFPAGPVDWAFDGSLEKSYSFFVPLRTDDVGTPQVLGGTLWSNLGHAISTSRTRMKPRFAAHATLQQGAVIVMDQDDRTLRRSSYDGDGVHEDMNFPEAVEDINHGALMLPMSGHGTLMGLAFHRDNIVALHQGDIEVRDLQSGILSRIISVDVASKESVNEEGPGLSWASHSGLWLLPSDGSAERLINPFWKNLYDGRLKTNDGITPYITAEARQRIIAGWDYTYQERIFLIETATDDGLHTESLAYRWNGKSWNVREFLTPITSTSAAGDLDFRLKSSTSTTVNIEWDSAPSDWNVDKFLIYGKRWRSDIEAQDQDYTLVAEVASDRFAFTDTLLWPGYEQFYKFRVRLVGGQLSPWLGPKSIYTKFQGAWDTRHTATEIGRAGSGNADGWKEMVLDTQVSYLDMYGNPVYRKGPHDPTKWPAPLAIDPVSGVAFTVEFYLNLPEACNGILWGRKLYRGGTNLIREFSISIIDQKFRVSWMSGAESFTHDFVEPAWQVDVYYRTRDRVYVDGQAYVCQSSHTSTEDNKPGSAGGDDYWSQTEFETIPLGAPEWIIDKGYTVGDVVRHNGIAYACTEAHTSTGDNEPTSGADQSRFWSQTTDAHHWAFVVATVAGASPHGIHIWLYKDGLYLDQFVANGLTGDILADLDFDRDAETGVTALILCSGGYAAEEGGKSLGVIIDEVRYWDDLVNWRSDQEILDSMNSIIQAEEGLLARWGFDNFKEAPDYNTYGPEFITEGEPEPGQSKAVDTAVFTGDNLLVAGRIVEPLFPGSFVTARPVLVSPGDGQADVPTSTTLDWEGISGTGVTYEVQVGLDAAFSQLVVNHTGVEGSSLDVSGLVMGTVYYWRVRGSTLDHAGPWSETWSFTTELPASPTFVGSSRPSVSGRGVRTAITIPAPPGSTGGDLLLAAIFGEARKLGDTENRIITPPGGCTSIVKTVYDDINMMMETFWCVSGAADLTFTTDKEGSLWGVIVAYRAQDPNSPVDAAAGQVNGVNTALYAPSVTTAGENRRVLGLHLVDLPVLGYDIQEPSTAWERVDGAWAQHDASWDFFDLEIHDETFSGAGSTGPLIATIYPGRRSIGQTIAIKPLPPP